MVDPAEFLCSLQLLCLFVRLVQMLRKYLPMVLCSNSSRRASPAPSLSWKRVTERPLVASKRSKDSSDRKVHPVLEDGVGFVSRECRPAVKQVAGVSKADAQEEIGEQEENVHVEGKENPGHPVAQIKVELDCLSSAGRVVENKLPKTRRRPARIVIPKPSADSAAFGVADKEQDDGIGKEMEVEGGDYCVASRRGHRHRMEDGYEVISNVHGDSKQAFFGVFDGHGGRAAVDFVSEKLGKNIVIALDELDNKEEIINQTELAIKAGYLTTDREFLSQGVSSGACAATVLVKDEELHVANVGDCRVVMSWKGLANALTDDHRAAREDERNRIENSGGYVTCRNGIWRVQDSLAVSRAIGDMNMKEWIISEPDTTKVQLTPDCEFLIMASDGLWDKVTNQEAVDVVSKNSNPMKSCKDLIEISSMRGNRDDITVMVIDLQKFIHLRG